MSSFNLGDLNEIKGLASISVFILCVCTMKCCANICIEFHDDSSGDAEAGWSNNIGEFWPEQEKDGQDQFLSPTRDLRSRSSQGSLRNTSRRRRNSAKVIQVLSLEPDKGMEMVDIEAEYADELTDLAKPKEIARSMVEKRQYS